MTVERPLRTSTPHGAANPIQPPVEFPIDSVRGGSRTALANLVLFGGASGLVFLLYLLHATVVARVHYSFTHYAETGWASFYALLLVLALYALDPIRASKWWRAGVLGALGGATAATVISLIQLVLGSHLLPRFVVLSSAILMAPLAILARKVAGHGKIDGGSRLIACGQAAELSLLERDFRDHRGRPAALVGFVTIEQLREGTSLDLLARTSAANTLVLSSAALADDEVIEQAQRLHSRGIRVRTFVQFYEQWLGKIPVSELERSSLLVDVGELHASYRRVKRAVDWLGVVPLGLLLAVSIPFVWVGNWFGNRGPLFYTQSRVGKSGDVFTIIKFRTMTPHSEPTTWTTHDDPRVTPFGRFLRRSHLDELPQILNVVTGDLSLVGPRPEQPAYVSELAAELPFYSTRHIVRPGITGWAQVRYPYGASTADSLEKLQYDFYYVYNQGLTLDLLCMLRTLQSIGRGAR